MSTTSTETRARSGVEVRLEDLRKVYSGVTALDGLSLTIGQGELVALLGPSGCGKTTAMRLVAGLEEANGGRVVIGGQDVTNLGANKREIGMVFQAYSLFPHMTATQNVEFGLQLHKVGVDERRKRAREMLDLVGLSAHSNKYASQMSGGQQQRVALARALAIQPTPGCARGFATRSAASSSRSGSRPFSSPTTRKRRWPSPIALGS